MIPAASSWAQPRGYQPRACGFDFNFNGIRGEAADCNVCDGVTTDVDGNGVTDTLIYVDCGSGTNNSSCGSTSSPCRTASYALNNRIGAPASRQIQAICVRGTCASETLEPFRSGDNSTHSGDGATSGYYTVSATGSQARSFQYPRYPLVITSWDDDNDGCYWPEDDGTSPPAGCGAAQTPAVFDGNASGNTTPWFTNAEQDRIEAAHLTIRDYNLANRSVESNGQTIVPHGGYGGGDTDHLFFHDLVVPVQGSGDEGGVVSAYGGNGNSYEAYENIHWQDFSGFVGWRGACDGICGPVRWQNISITKRAGGAPGAVLAKAWGRWTGIELLDSELTCANSDNAAWRVKDCNQDVVIRNNRITNCTWAGINIESDSGAGEGGCESRPVDSVVLDRNEISTQLADANGNGGIYISEGRNNLWAEDVTITNNIIWWTTGFDAAIVMFGEQAGGTGDVPGAWTVIGNTFSGNPGAGLGLFPAVGVWIGANPGGGARQQHLIYRNNIHDNTGDRAEQLITCGYRPTDFRSEDNVYPSGASDGVFACYGATNSLRTYQDNLGGCPGADNDCSATRCDPSFVGGSDYHIRAIDSCAQGSASDPDGNFTLCTTCVDSDIDGDPRPQGAGWDAGADEQGAGQERPPIQDQTSASGRLRAGESARFPLNAEASSQVLLTLFWSRAGARASLQLSCDGKAPIASSGAEQRFLRLEAAVDDPSRCAIEVTSEKGDFQYWLSIQWARATLDS